jgi:hypothetical protein
MIRWGNPTTNEQYQKFLKKIEREGENLSIVPSQEFANTLNLLEDYGASLILLPRGGESGSLYTYKPYDGSADFTVTRNSIGTYFDRDGILRIAQPNVTRLDYDPETREFKGVLVEPQVTNRFTNNNTNLVVQNSYSSSSILLNEFGDFNGFMLNQNAGSFLSFSYTIGTSQFPVPENSVITYSTIIKNPSSQFYGLGFSFLPIVIFDFFNLNVNILNNSNRVLFSEIKKIHHNTYLINIIFTNTELIQFFQARQGLVNSFTSQVPVNGNFIIGLPTLSVSSSFTPISSLIPTQGSQATRTADVIQRLNAQNLIGQSEGAIYVEFIMNFSLDFNKIVFGVSQGNTRILSIGTQNNRVVLIRRFVTNYFSQMFGPTFNTGDTIKVCVVYTNTVQKLFINGVQISITSVDYTDTVFNQINNSGDGIFQTNTGTNNKISSLFTRALTDEEAINLTKL